MIFRNKKKEEPKHSILSAVKPKPKLDLSLNKKENTVSKGVREKQILNIFIDVETNRKFIESFAAYAIGLTNVRAVMLDNPKYYEITTSKIKELENRGCEVNYIELPKRKKIIVYSCDDEYYIDMSSAYVLGYIDVKQFYDVSNDFYLLDNAKFEYIKNNYDVEYNQIINESNKRR